jgi:hypothetical protein
MRPSTPNVLAVAAVLSVFLSGATAAAIPLPHSMEHLGH